MTDADLAKLKVACLLSVQEYGNKDAKDILGVIARLEAAEKLIGRRIEMERQNYSEDFYAWQKAAGK